MNAVIEQDQIEVQAEQRLSGDRNQCPTCGEYFNSTAAFEKHRIGEYGMGLRRCLSVEEMLCASMVISSQGFWITRAFDAEGLAWTSKLGKGISDILAEKARRPSRRRWGHYQR